MDRAPLLARYAVARVKTFGTMCTIRMAGFRYGIRTPDSARTYAEIVRGVATAIE